MKIAGFTFVKNAVKYDYPVCESINSILPLCDIFVVSVGDCEDGTEEKIRAINSDKIRIVHSVWEAQQGGHTGGGGIILAHETNKAMDAVGEGYDWLFYLQADEIMHEKFLIPVEQAMRTHLHNSRVEGLLFGYEHFYGSYDYVGNSRVWYRHEIRVIRNDPRIRSYRDAQGFRKDGRKLQVKESGAQIYHYGWVKHPKVQLQKRVDFEKLYHKDVLQMQPHVADDEGNFVYENVHSVVPFTGTQPSVMRELIARKNWQFTPSKQKMKFDKWQHRLLYWIEKWTGRRLFEYKNYKKI